MRLLTFKCGDELALGVKTDKGVLDVRSAAHALGICCVADTPDALYAQGLDGLTALRMLVERALADETHAEWWLDEASLSYGPCVPNPEKILCIGLNYRRHAAESGAKVPEVPVLFSKFNNALAAHNEAVPLVKGAAEYDYEVELGVVIGRQTKYVETAQALELPYEEIGKLGTGASASSDGVLTCQPSAPKPSPMIATLNRSFAISTPPCCDGAHAVPPPSILRVFGFSPRASARHAARSGRPRPRPDPATGRKADSRLFPREAGFPPGPRPCVSCPAPGTA